jgi:uracil-DNA glycosylase family 4
MRFQTITELRQAVIRCPLACPYRNEAPGYYPKPPRGPESSEVMMVFENPGSPEGRNTIRDGKPEMDFTIANIALPDALRFCIQGMRAWLFQSNRLNKATWDEAGFIVGETIYTTDSHKCPNPRDPEKEGQKDTARRMCLDYLREEIRLIQPRAIIAFGEHARKSVEKICGVQWSGSLKRMEREQRVAVVGGRLYALLPHPDGLWRNPPMTTDAYEEAIAFVFGKVKAHLGER